MKVSSWFLRRYPSKVCLLLDEISLTINGNFWTH